MAFKCVSVIHSSKISFKRTNGHLDPEAGMSKHIQRSDTMAKFFEGIAKEGPPTKKRRISRVNSVTDEQSLRAYGEEVIQGFATSCLTLPTTDSFHRGACVCLPGSRTGSCPSL